MKPLFLFCLFAGFANATNAQLNDTGKTYINQQLQDQYTSNYKSYKTAGWILLGAGTVMIVAGGIGTAKWAAQGYNGSGPATAEAFLLIAGPTAALVSIPFFILARHSKNKAALSLKKETVSFNTMPYQPAYTALALTIKL